LADSTQELLKNAMIAEAAEQKKGVEMEEGKDTDKEEGQKID